MHPFAARHCSGPLLSWSASSCSSVYDTQPSKGHPKIYQGIGRYPVTKIILHCADTRPYWMMGRPLVEDVTEIRRWHVEQRGWRDIGYHWVIDRDGKRAPERSETEIGSHVEGHNRGTIGTCLLGGYGAKADDQFESDFTPVQREAVVRLIVEIKARTAIRTVSGHNDYAVKACPGFQVTIVLKLG